MAADGRAAREAFGVDREIFREELNAQIQRARKQGRRHLEVNAGELHRKIGGFPPRPGEKHAMHACCAVMLAELTRGDAMVVHEGAKNEAYALTIRYDLPRPPSMTAISDEIDRAEPPSTLDTQGFTDLARPRQPLAGVLFGAASAHKDLPQ